LLERLARLEAAYDDLLAEEFAGAPGLVEVMAVVGRIRNKQVALDLKATGAFDASKEWMANGSRSAAAWLMTSGHEKHLVPQRRVRLARALRTMPHTERALAAGAITVDHVEALAAEATGELAQVFADSERRLVDKAKTLRFRAFAVELQYWRDIADPDGAEDRADRQLADAHWYASKSFEGQVCVNGWLDPIGGSIYLTELGRLEQWLFEQDWAEAAERVGEGNVTTNDLSRTPAQRRAAAQVLMAVRSASTTLTGSGIRAVLNVVMDWATFCAELARRQGRTDVMFPDERTCRLADGTILAPSQALSLGLAGEVRRLVLDPDGVPLDYGQSRRFFTGDPRTAIELAFPYCTDKAGCDVTSHRCQIDHIVPFTDLGPTNPTNGRPLCGPHNRHKETQDRKIRKKRVVRQR
jgi:hypothetical protein